MRIGTSGAIAVALAILNLTTAARADTRCAVRADVPTLVQVQERWLAALLAGDRVGFDRRTAEDFRFVERGRELDRGQLFEMVRDVLGKGTVLRWNVTRPHADVDCSLAVLNYVNDGSVSQAGGPAKHVRWFETAVLRRSGGGWLVSFASSERVVEGDADASGGDTPPNTTGTDRHALDPGAPKPR